MKKWRIISLGKLNVYLHPSVMLYLLYASLTGHLRLALIAYLSIILHEASHVIAAVCMGQQPECMEITPLGAVMHLEDEARLTPIRRAFVTMAGPAVTWLLCCLGQLCTKLQLISWQSGMMIFASNLCILIMNLLPAIPLDGGRLLLILIENVFTRDSASKVLKIISNIIGTGLIAVNVFLSWKTGGFNMSLAFAGCCILYSASMFTVTRAMSELRFFLDRRIMIERKGYVKTIVYTVRESTKLCQIVKSLPARKLLLCLCAENGSGRLLGCIHEFDLIHAYLESPELSLGKAVKTAQIRYELSKSDTI